jgi:hypothetical protein
MGPSSFRVTASTGTWRTLPWPFGVAEVSDDELCVRSIGWSWWVPDRCVNREHVESISVQKTLGTSKFTIAIENALSITLRTSTSANQLTDALRQNGYPLI